MEQIERIYLIGGRFTVAYDQTATIIALAIIAGAIISFIAYGFISQSRLKRKGA